MKSCRPTGWLCTWRLLTSISIVLADIPMVKAAEIGDQIGIVVAVSLITSLLTTATTLGVLYCVRRYMTKKNRLKRDPATRASIVSSVPGSLKSDESAQPLTGRYIRQQSALSTTSSVNGDLRKSRVKSDFIAKWCTDHNLTEKTAEVLREHGFTYPEALQAMDIDDISKLGLQRAQECLLRQVLSLRQRNTSSSSKQNVYRANSDEVLPLNSITSHNTSGASSGVFERTQSMDNVDGIISRPLQGSIMKRKSMGSSMEILEDHDNRGESTIIIRSSKTVVQDTNPALVHYTKMTPDKNNGRRFNGLLSDKGLWQLARMIGVEWPRLATLLGVPQSVQAQIKMDHPSNTLHQIYSVLRIWRDTCEGSKQHVKGVLYNALCKCERSDLGEDILREETHGSEEKVSHHSVI